MIEDQMRHGVSMKNHRYVIMTYSNGSSSAKRIKKGFLERGLKCIILKNKNSKYKQRSKDILINWGRSKIHEKVNPRQYIFNWPEFVKNAIDKRIMAKKFWDFNREKWPEGGINYITHLNKSQALKLMDEGHSIVERHLGSSSKGKGVRVCHDKNELRDALFYTKYIKKRDEYRCHVAYDVEKNVYSVLDIRKKLRRRGQKPLSREVRSHDNGWVFVTLKDMTESHVINCIKENSISAVYLLGLDFGAVDLIHDKNSGEVYVLEVNTAPGLKSKVYEKYVSSFAKLKTLY